MKYSSSNKPLVCMQTQSTCYKGTSIMTPVGVLWHSTGANNPTLKRYVQPSDVKPPEDTYDRAKWLEVLGKNVYSNDWNHIERQAGLNCWIGKLADGTVTTVQTLPWNYKPWGCGSGANGSCNTGWMQFEICEDSLTDKNYFDAVYKEACEITAYYCKMYNINPKGTVVHNGVTVPTILCHKDSYKLGLGSNHGDIYHWFNKYGKTMDDVRKDVAKLMSESASSAPAIQTVKQYKVVVDIPCYSTASAAKSKTGAKGTYTPGTYYIYNKYPDGVNGMFNISRDASGASAGSWINPADNVVKVQEEVKVPESPVVQKLYRVRTSWTDAKSQKGAFSSLTNAKECCQSAGAGYKVFDWDGKEVYAYASPATTPTQPETNKEEKPVVSNKAAYDLDYPQKHIIVDPAVKYDGNICEESCTKAIVAIKKNNAAFDVEIAKAFFLLAPKYRIDPMRAISQSILETGWFKFAGSSVKAEQHNYCGLGATGGGVSGASFDTIENGVRAQLQHLYAYGCKDALPEDTIIDPRFRYVTRGIAPSWEQLAGRWAVPGYAGDSAEASMKAGTTYGQKIDKICDGLNSTAITDADIDKYFPKEQKQEASSDNASITPPAQEVPQEPDTGNSETPSVEVTPEVPTTEALPEAPIVSEEKPTEDTKEKVDIEKVNFIIGLIEKILKAIIKFFRKAK